MKKLLSIALIISLSFATTRVVCSRITIGPFVIKNCCVSGTDYDTIADALNNANNGDEVVICPLAGGVKASYNESDLNITDKNLYIHSYQNDPSKVEVYDDSGKPIFDIERKSVKIEGITITQNSNKEAIYINRKRNHKFKNVIINSKGKGIYFNKDTIKPNFNSVNITSSDTALYFKKGLYNATFNKMQIKSDKKGIYIGSDNEDNTFSELNITSKDRCFDSVGAIFDSVTIKNSEFNQTSSGKYAFVSYGNPFEDNNFSNVKISSKGYGFYFDAGLTDSNFTNVYTDISDDAFVVNSGDMNNIRFIDSNLSSENGRALSVSDSNGGSLLNSYFDDFNLSANYEALYVDTDISNTTFKNFILKGSYGVYGNNYIKNSVFENGEINVSDTGIYSDKEFNQSTLNNLYIKAPNYGLWFSQNSGSGAINDENRLTNLVIIQTSSSSSSYSGIKFRKKVNNSLLQDINITSEKRGIWLSTGGKYNTFNNLDLNSSGSNSFVNSNLIEGNNFSNIKFYSDKSSAISFNGDVKSNTFENLYVESNQSNGIYSKDGVVIENNEFRTIKVFAYNYGIYFKDNISDNNFTNLYVRVNHKYSGIKFGKYSTNDYLLNIDGNGTKGIEFNISQGDIVQKATLVTNRNEPLYFSTIKSAVALYDLNLTSTKDNCIYVYELDADLNVSTKAFYKNEFNCSVYHGIQISQDSTASINVKDTNFIINSDSVSTSRAVIKASSLHDLNVTSSVLNGNDVRSGIYIKKTLDNLYVYKSVFLNANDRAIYIGTINDSLEIRDSNFSKSAKYAIRIDAVGSGFNKGEIKRNYFIDNSDYAIDIFDGSENDNANFEIWTNCFYDNQDTDGDSQAYTYDASNAKYDDGKAGNFWSDWNESGPYQIDPKSIDLYDNHPLYYCPLNVLFDARDTNRDFTDRNISIKIAGKKFDLTIFDITGGEYKGTVCSRILDTDNNNTAYTGWMKLYFNDDVEKNLTNIEVNHSVRSAIVHIVWNAKDESCEDLLNDDHNASFSTDTFAIRPYKYKVKFSKMPLYAAEAFDLNVSAISYRDKILSEYNSTDINISADMNRSELNCTYPDAEFNLSSLDFNKGESNNTAKFDEVGELNLTIIDNDFDLAKGGEDECNDSNACISVYGYDGKDSKGVFCCDIQANPKWDINLSEVDVKVYDLNITRNVINTPYNTDWIYMDNNLSEFNASPTIEITAFNKSGKQLQNFDKECVAKDMNISFGYYVYNENGDINLTYKGIVEKNGSIKDFNKTLEVNKSIFIKGDTNASYAFNVDRNNSKALYVVYANLKELNFTTNNLAKYENNLSTDLNISMYYGNMKTFDISTNKDSIDVKVYYIVYDNDSNYKPSNENKSFNWYLNTKHTNKEGNLSSIIHISDGYIAKDTYNSKFNISIDDVDKGEQVIHITRNDPNIHFAVFHLTMDKNISNWLWFSYGGEDYNDSLNSTCAHHFCFAITWKEANNEDNSRVVKSGDTLGTEANITEYNRTSKGVKIYR